MILLQVMFSRGAGGLERVFVDHARLLAARGHEVHCLLPARAPVLPDLQALAAHSDGRLRVHPLPTQGLARLWLRWRLRRSIAALAPQAIIAHGAKTVTRLMAVRPPGVPVMAVTHNASARLRQATHLVALTQSLRQHFLALGFDGRRVSTLPNPLPGHCLDAPRAERTLQWPLVVGVLCRWVYKKGLDVFLRGFRRALDLGLDAVAVIGGDGPERPRLEALRRELGLEAQVRLIGWVEDPRRFYEQVDLCCVPSRDEPFGLVVLEGFAHGTPVLAARVGGPAELVTPGVNGELFASEDPESLARALLRMADPAYAAQLRRGGYAALDAYRPEAVAAQLDAALQAAVQDLAGELR